MRVVMTGADGFLGWHTREIALANCSERAVNYLGLNLRTPCSLGTPERPVARMNPSDR
jgi:nucleoside-diphosphate-sugar epimerase